MGVLGRALASLSFRAKLTLSFVALSFLAIAGVGTTLTTLSNQQAVAALREKATRFTTLIAPQLEPVVAFDDKITAHEIFQAFGADPDVTGLAVYRASGEAIDGYGAYPGRLIDNGVGDATAGSIVVLAPIESREGPRGTLYVSFGTEALEQYRRHSTLTAVAIGAVALVIAVGIATMLARPVARRIATIAAAAGRVAQGDLHQPEIESGANDEIGRLARGFNVMVAELRRQFVEREQLAATEQARLEAIVAARTAEVNESREQYRLVAESTHAIPFTYDPATQCFTYVGPQAEKRLAHPLDAWRRPRFLLDLLSPDDAATIDGRFNSAAGGSDFEFECSVRAADGRTIQVRWVVTCKAARDGLRLYGLILDVSDQRRLELELRQAQKLESVGRLAAGVAHEINTPVQFVSDSVRFVRDSITELSTVLDQHRSLCRAVADGQATAEQAAAVSQAEQDADVDYLLENVPSALERSLEGLDRVATIVRSMKEFAHPDKREMSAIDLNQSIQSTLTIARNEYKYVADVETDFGELPRVLCHGGDVNQAILNIVVNAAHAIGDLVAGTEDKGRIVVRTRCDGDQAVVSIADTGGGIPETVRHRVFDPFFTTKEVGKGTGQGLAIARSVITEKHHGELSFESEMGVGTTFTIRLPIDGGVSATSPEAIAVEA
jgi:signal transduction histidine kinase